MPAAPLVPAGASRASSTHKTWYWSASCGCAACLHAPPTTTAAGCCRLRREFNIARKPLSASCCSLLTAWLVHSIKTFFDAEFHHQLSLLLPHVRTPPNHQQGLSSIFLSSMFLARLLVVSSLNKRQQAGGFIDLYELKSKHTFFSTVSPNKQAGLDPRQFILINVGGCFQAHRHRCPDHRHRHRHHRRQA